MSKYTRKAIMSSFMELLQKKSLDKITVKEIIESAQVNRNTFYYHFQDIYDLMEQMFLDESERFRSGISPDSSFYEEYVRFAGIFIEDEAAIRHVYDSRSREVLNTYIHNTIRHSISGFVRRAAEGTGLSEKGMAYITWFYTFSIIGATTRWLEGQLPDYDDRLIRTVADSFDATIGIMIRTYIDGHPEECAGRRQ